MISQFSRRSFMAASAGWAAAAPLHASSRGASPSISFPVEPRRRLSVSTYPFRDFIAPTVKQGGGKTPLSLAQFAATIPAKFGVYGIEPWSRHFESTTPVYIGRLREAFEKAQVRVVNIPCDVNVQACGTPEERQQAQAKWRQWVDLARALGSPSIRVHVAPPASGEYLPAAAEALKRITDYSAGKGIVINLENDDPKTEDPYQLVKVIDAVKSPWLHALPDFANSMFIQDDRNYNAKALGALFPHAFNITHVKDREVGEGKTVMADVPELFSIAAAAGYKGYFSMEYEGGADPYEGSAQLITASLKSLAS